MDLDDEKLARLNKNRLYVALGIRITEAADGVAISRMEAEPEVCWPVAKQPHGGIVFTQVDTTMATAVMSVIGDEQRLSTISVDIQYINPALADYLECEARITHRSGRMAFLRAETKAPDGTLVALGQGTFRIFAENHGVHVL